MRHAGYSSLTKAQTGEHWEYVVLATGPPCYPYILWSVGAAHPSGPGAKPQLLEGGVEESGGHIQPPQWLTLLKATMGFPGGSGGKESALKAGDLGLIPRSGRPPGEGNGNPLQYPCLEDSMRAWRAAVHGVTKNQT